MKKLLLILLLCWAANSIAQVGIANTDPKAQLDISASNLVAPSNTDGILIPRVGAFSAINPTAAQNGMMVFLTTAIGSTQPGFYYWDNPTATWIGVGRTTSNQWNLAGNAGTSPFVNFIGTSDDTDLVFKRNSIQAGKITTGNAFFGNGSGLVAIGNLNTYIGADAGTANINGTENVFVGRLAGGGGNTGSDNVFVGNAAGLSNTANNNVFVGAYSGNSNTTSGGSTFIGSLSGMLSSGATNTFVGAGSGSGNTVGSGNTLLGNSANVSSNNLTNATAVGRFATAGASNSLVLGSISGVNGATNTVNVGIGTTTPLDRLHVAGNIRMVDGNQAAGKVLTSDINGTATWQLASANAWGMTGNTGTSSVTNFIGTTDNQDVVFKRNNVKSGLLNLNNTAFGVNALTATTTGNNTAFGFNALHVNTASLNAAFGSRAMQANTTGSQNTALGTEAMSSNTIGSNNVAVGYDALMFNTVARNNVAVGYLALFNQSFSNGNVTFDSNNIAIGRSALANNQPTAATNGINNLAVGTFALLQNTIGAGNLAIGNSALQDNTVSSENTAIGFEALKTMSFTNGNTAYASNNTAIGYQSMMNTQPTDPLEADANVAVGARTLRANTIGSYNVALGSSALESSTAASNNTAVGYLSLSDTTTGDNNTSIGAFSMSFNTTGNNNVAIGSNSMTFNERGSSNIAIGLTSLFSNRSSSHNIGIGYQALHNQSFTNGNTAFFGYNVAVGYSALVNNNPTASTNGIRNTAIGESTLLANTIGFKNTALGSGADVTVNNLSNATAIGADAAVGASNSLVLGSINGVNGATASANVGIGTTTPLSTLDIVSANVSTTSTIRGNLSVMASDAGNIDIGAALTLGGFRDAAATQFRVYGSVEGRKSTASAASSDGYLQFKTNNGGTLTEHMRINESGNVGIGTIAPQAQLDVADNNVITSLAVEGNANICTIDEQGIDIGGSLSLGGRYITGSAATRNFATIEGRKSNATSNNSAGYLIFKTDSGGAMLERIRITNAGDVGIGTAIPGGQFELSLNEGRKPGTNTWTVASDARLKNVSGEYTKGLKDVVKLKPIRYHYKNTGDKKFDQKVLDEEFAGFLAQEVQQVFPEAVGTDKDGYLNFNMHSILVASVNAIRELDEKNAQLTTSLQSQNEKVKRLEKELQEQKELLQSILDRLPKN